MPTMMAGEPGRTDGHIDSRSGNHIGNPGGSHLGSHSGTPTDGHSNGWAGVTSTGVAVLLDGRPGNAPSGCVHDTPWFVRQLGGRLLILAGEPRTALAAALAEAIDDVAGSHGPDCDLTAPGTPAAAVAMVREAGDAVEYLVLADAIAVFDTGQEPTVVTAPPAGPLAAHDPEVARQAVAGTVRQPRGVVLLSRGAAALVTAYGAMTWRELVDVARDRGPAELIAATREVERSDAARTVWPRPHTHEDATVVVHTPHREGVRPVTGPGH